MAKPTTTSRPFSEKHKGTHMNMTRKKALRHTNPTEIARLLRLSSRLADFAIKSTGVSVIDTMCSQKIDTLDFATQLEALLNNAEFSEKLGLINLRQFSNRLVSPPELIILALEIDFVSPMMLAGIPFWPLADINLLFNRCGAKWKTVRQLAELTSLSIAQLSLHVVEGRLPKITTRFFVPGWHEADLKLFLSQGDRLGIGGAGQYDIDNGRIYLILDAPEPLRTLDKTVAIHAFLGPTGHPVQLEDGRYGWVAEHLDEIRFRPNKSAELVKGNNDIRAGHAKEIRPRGQKSGAFANGNADMRARHAKKIKSRRRKSGQFVEVTDDMLIGLLSESTRK